LPAVDIKGVGLPLQWWGGVFAAAAVNHAFQVGWLDKPDMSCVVRIWIEGVSKPMV